MTSNSKKKWFILDCVTQIQSQPLSEDQIRMTLMRITEKEYDRYFVWTNTWENWQSVRLFLKSEDPVVQRIINKDSEKKKAATKEDTITKSSTYVKTDDETTAGSSYRYINLQKDTDMNQINMDQVKLPNNIDFKKLVTKEAYKHRMTRHDLKIEVLLISKLGKTFRSYSKNISLSGSLLEDNVPFDYYGEMFDVVVVNRYAKDPANSRVQIKGVTVGDGVSRRIEFEPYTEAAKVKLVFLLNEYLENQKAAGQKAS